MKSTVEKNSINLDLCVFLLILFQAPFFIKAVKVYGPQKMDAPNLSDKGEN